MRVITDTGPSLGWIVILVPVFDWLLYPRLRRLAGFVGVTALGSALLNNTIKLVVGRASRMSLTRWLPRSASRSPAAIPRRRWSGTGSCFSRIAFGVHYLSDVFGALLIGVAWMLAMTAAFAAWRRDPGDRSWMTVRHESRRAAVGWCDLPRTDRILEVLTASFGSSRDRRRRRVHRDSCRTSVRRRGRSLRSAILWRWRTGRGG
jgi:membrane-associated phospholipid phosphatase